MFNANTRQAPESLRDLQYSTKSDVWSFGIVCTYFFSIRSLLLVYSAYYLHIVYEIVSRNEPHIDVDPLEVAVKIK